MALIRIYTRMGGNCLQVALCGKEQVELVVAASHSHVTARFASPSPDTPSIAHLFTSQLQPPPWYVLIFVLNHHVLTPVCALQLPAVAPSHSFGHLHVHICPCHMARFARQKQNRGTRCFLEIRPHRRAPQSVRGHWMRGDGIQRASGVRSPARHDYLNSYASFTELQSTGARSFPTIRSNAAASHLEYSVFTNERSTSASSL